MNKYARFVPVIVFAIAAFKVVPALVHRGLPAPRQQKVPTLAPVRLASAVGSVVGSVVGSAAAQKHDAKAAPVKRGASVAAKTASAKFGQIPLAFEANAGQTAQPVKFLSRGSGYSLFLTAGEAVFSLAKPAPKSKSPEVTASKPAVLRMKLVGASETPRVSGQSPLAGRVNYFIGNDKTKWRTNVSTFGKVKYEKVYPGVDLVYYGNQRQLEYDFVVAPGADPSRIKLAFSGADNVAVDDKGGLTVHTGGEKGGEVSWKKPCVYQQTGGKRHEIESSYEVKDAGVNHEVSFRLAAYDTAKPLIIDPVLDYSTYLGGTGSETGAAITLDSSNNAYVVGNTTSTDFPTTAGVFQAAGTGSDAFVTKLNSTGTAVVFSTYVGGSGGDSAAAVALDTNKNIYITGDTSSTNYPTVGAIQGTFGGRADAFVTKLDSTGATLGYSTYLGGGFSDSGAGIAVDDSANAYVTGETQSSNFPTTAGALQTAIGGSTDAFVSKVNSGGTALTYSTYLGGTDVDQGVDIKVDASGNVYAVGSTISTDFPLTAGVFQTTPGGDEDVFVVNLNAAGTAETYATLIGGNDHDIPTGLAIDASGNVYITGNTGATDFPTTAGAYQTALKGTRDAFVTKLNSAGTALTFSTYLGGAGNEDGGGIAIDSTGNVYVCGTTDSFDFPLFKTLQSFGSGGTDGFVTSLNTSASTLLYSTYYGGTAADSLTDLALDSSGTAYVVGTTSSTDFPTSSTPVQGASGGSDDAVVAKITSATAPIVVNNTGDVSDVNLADGTCDSDGTTAGSQCTLRAAIETANANPGPDTIEFVIGRSGLRTIAPGSALPDITGVVTINGYTQGGASANTLVTSDNATVNIQISGGGAGAGVNGLTLTSTAAGSTITGLVINGFTGYGILLNNSSNNTIAGNFIGTDPTGLIDQGNGTVGVGNSFGTASDNSLIGGVTPAARNIISGNGTNGVDFNFSTGTTVRGNFIGLGADGATNVGNTGSGINATSFVVTTTIGGDDAADGTADGVVNARNIISGNGGTGVFCGGAGFGGATIQGNYIGTNAAGTALVGNVKGIDTNLSTGIFIGGTTAGAGNIVAGCSNQAITLGNTNNAIVKGNFIGVASDGTTGLGNSLSGIFFLAGSSGAQIGGVGVGEANIIAGSGENGVDVGSGNNNVIRGNSIYGNDANGIDLGSDDVTANDTKDPDTGANDLQNYPVITSITTGSSSVVKGTLNSLASSSFNVDVYSNVATTLSGFGQGQTYLGGVTVTTDANGDATFSFPATGVDLTGKYISATATPTVTPFNTSEFAQAVLAGQNFVVDTTSDASLTACTAAAGDCSLRGAIANVNANATTAVDNISFAIPTSDSGFAAGVYTFEPTTSVYPDITKPVVIDGSTQSGYTSTPVIVIRGDHLGSGLSGLTLRTTGATVRALCINSWLRANIDLPSGVGLGTNLIEACFLGTNPAGTSTLGSTYGLFVGSNSNTIGGSTASARNIISGNVNNLVIFGGVANNVFGNYIGVAPDGVSVVGAFGPGVTLQSGASSNNIGFLTTAQRNVISGNTVGVRIQDAGTTNNDIGANYIGLGADGTTVVPNTGNGVEIDTAVGNFIGLGGAGGNVISGNGAAGVSVANAPSLNTIQLNIIGLDSGKTLDRGNATDGVLITDSSGTSVRGNTLSGNGGNGVQITTAGGASSGNVVSSNSIGTTNLLAVLGNTGNGILLDGTASGNFIGGSGVGNAIANNAGAGVRLSSTVGIGNHISQNTITADTGLGIDLGATGVTANDAKDPDTGPNNLQNFPVITSVVNGANSVVNGTLNSSVGDQFVIELYENTAKDSSGNGEGEIYLGSVTTGATDANGDVSWNFTATGVDLTGQFVSATATPTGGVTSPSTSEFSAAFPGTVTYVVDTTSDASLTACTAAAGDCSLRGAITAANANTGADIIDFNIPTSDPNFAAGVYTTSPATVLPTITDAVTIDGYTQPGASANTLATGSNAVIAIQINGTGTSNVAGLTVTGANSTIKGLAINRFTGGATAFGMSISGTGATGNTIQGCYLGTNAAGTASQQNIGAGVILQGGANNNIIGGTTRAARNVISGNLVNGVRLTGSGTSANQVIGNYIGLGADGTTVVKNSSAGVSIQANASGNSIGNLPTGSGNVISGNQSGVTMDGSGGAVTGNLVRGNLIGTDAAGTVAKGNTGTAVSLISNANSNAIGAATAAAANVIAGSIGGAGIGVVASNSNSVQGNYIGTNAAGADLGNSNMGIGVSTSSVDNVFGGPAPGAGNTIAFNHAEGIQVQGSISTGNSIRCNKIHDNRGLGIDLQGDGSTANDAKDPDTGTNNLQNFPVITSVVNSANSVVSGTLNSTVGDTFVIDVFSNTTADGTGFGEGESYLGSVTTAATDANGDVSWTFTATGHDLTGKPVTATATRNATPFDTSEFSAAFSPAVTYIVDTTSDDPTLNSCTAAASDCSLRGAINDANANPAVDTISFAIPGGGVQTISPTTALPAITDPVTINGYSQTGSSVNTLTTGDNAVINIRIDGSSTGAGINGLSITGGSTTVKGLAISGFQGAAISTLGGTGNTIVGNFIGTDATGSAAAANGVGISIASNNDVVGDIAPSFRNIIAGNSTMGIEITGTATSTKVRNNYIGVAADGASALGNGATGDGIFVNGVAFITIGGNNANARNVISGNAGSGISVANATLITISGNYIGTDATGASDLGNGTGITQTNSSDDIIGGASAAAGNVISGNVDGIIVKNATAPAGNSIDFNLVGLDATGTNDVGNDNSGITVQSSINTVIDGNTVTGNGGSGIHILGTTTTASSGNQVFGNVIGLNTAGSIIGNNQGVEIGDFTNNNMVGGYVAAQANVISGNGDAGVLLTGSATQNTVVGNFLGTDSTGTVARGNADGVIINAGASNNTIGGGDAADGTTDGVVHARNIISGNNDIGVFMYDTGTDSNKVQGNYIGTDTTGKVALGNSGDGICIESSAASNTVGGVNAGETNLISANGTGIEVNGANNNTIRGNRIGTDDLGSSALGSASDGIEVTGGASGTEIGGTSAAAGNLISGNGASGIRIDNGSTLTHVRANFIGTNAAGTAAIANGLNGVLIQNASVTNTVGTVTLAVERNIISGNSQDGVQITGTGTNGNTVTGNYVGLTSAGTAALANGNIGVDIVNGAQNNTVGGASAVLRNIVSGNARNGVGIGGNTGVTSGSNTKGNLVFGNYIGTNAAGTGALGNGLPGVAIGQSANNNYIGGANAGQGNLISGAGANDGVAIFDAGTSTNAVIGNLIGTDPTGTSALPNNTGVVILDGATGNLIGGTGASRNVISGNSNIGVYLENGASSNIVKGNFIGVKIDGASALGNGVGIDIDAGGGALVGSNNNTIGGVAAGEGNVIAFNNVGVLLPANPNASTGNAIRGNSIHDNSGLGINLEGGAEDAAGVTANDVGDGDTGSNNLQNYPVLTTVASSGGNTTFTGTLDGPAGTYTLDFYRNTVNDGEGKTYIGSSNIVKAAGAPTFNVSQPGTFTGQFVTATATISGNTSEFSAATTVTLVTGPTISAISPASGPRGTIVTITGTGFTGATDVTFNGAATTVFTVDSATQITATVPSAATTGPVAVTVAGLTGTSVQNFTVTTSPSSYVVTNTADGGSGSLRDAITFANANAGTDTITFKIPGAGVKTIAPVSSLPAISAPAIINGYTQPGSSANTLAVGDNAVLRIQLSGASAGTNSALRVTGGGSTIKGLVVNGFTNAAGIAISTGGSNRVNGCFLGTNPAGTAAVQNFSGVSIADSTGNVIGGASSAERNIISGNRITGVAITGAAAVGGNTIAGNYIGTNAAGSGIPTSSSGGTGISISGLSGNIIGGTTAASRNVISGNSSGVVLFTNNNTVQGNYIGLSASGAAKVANSGNGLFSQSAKGNLIGGLTATPGTAPGNVISGNGGSGIDSNGNASGGNTYRGNIIGLNAAGTAKIANTADGITIRNTGGGNTIGGTNANAGNVISGNGAAGVSLDNNGNSVLGNTIGAGVNGTSALGNARDGILINGDSGNIIGSLAANAANIIAFNAGNGVAITGTGTQNPVRGNSIFSNTKLGIDLGNVGVTANDAGDADTGANTLQNFPVITGVTVAAGKTTIAGTLDSSAGSFLLDFYRNTANDGEGKIFIGSLSLIKAAGVKAFSFTATGSFTGQSFTATATLSNNTSEFSSSKTAVVAPPAAPAITSISPTSGPRGTLVTINGTAFAGATAVKFNGHPTAVFTVNSATKITATVPVTATTGPVSVTTPDGTGASAQNFTVTASGYVVTNTNDSGSGSLRDAMAFADSHPGADTVRFNIPGAGVKTIAPVTALPTLAGAATTIDGTTQPGFVAAPLIVIAPVPPSPTPPNQTTALSITGANNVIKSLTLNANFDNVSISGAGATGNKVQGCYIGLTAAGTGPVACFTGVVINGGAKNNTVGGTTAATRNVIGGNDIGVLISGSGVTGNRVSGNYIGTAASGGSAVANQRGVWLQNGAQGNIIGGTTAGQGNLISGNNDGVDIENANGNVVLGNLIGTGKTGLSALHNVAGVVVLSGSTGNVVGGTIAGARNIISGNTFDGVKIDTATGNTIIGNTIGRNATDTANLANGRFGVYFAAGANNSTLGGTGAGAANIIGGNTGDGVRIEASGVTARGNSIYGDGGLGINLSTDGVTANDADDADSGPNALQNFPTLTQVGATASTITLRATLSSTANTRFILDLYSSPAADASGNGEGKTYVASSPVVMSDANGLVTRDFSVPISFVGQVFAATATSTVAKNTSEFGPGLRAKQGLGLSIAPAQFSESAGPNAATATVTRSGPTTAALTISVTSGDTGEATVPATKQFGVGVSTIQFPVAAIDDSATDGTQTVTISVSGTGYAPASQDVSVLDDEQYGVILSRTSGLVTTEAGGTATFTARLITAPTANVILTFASSNTGEGSVLTAPLTFTPANFASPQTVTVKGVDDSDDDGDVTYKITGALTGSDPKYVGRPVPNVSATNTDDDTAGFLVTPRSGLTTSESGGAATFTVALTSRPAHDVTVPLSSSDTGEGTVLPVSLTFTSLDYASPKTVTVTGVNDLVIDGNQPYKVILGAATSFDADYSGLSGGSVSLTNLDNDAAGSNGAIGWGYNEFGQLGDGSTTHRLSPVPAGFSGATALAAGGGHSLTMQGASALLAAGHNTNGQLGDGTTADKSTAVTVNGVSGVTAIAAGWYHSLALKSDGTVWAWGNNTSGQVGDGTVTDRTTAVQVKGLTDVKAIAAGVYHSVALRNDGTVWAWGNNFYGQLGNGTVNDSALPVQVSGITGATAVAAGGAHTLIVVGGVVRACGWNDDGQLGDDTLTARSLPVQVLGLSGVTAIGAGYSHSIALAGGTVVTWGDNAFGQLGNGTGPDSDRPVTLSGLTGVTRIAAGGAHNLVLKSDGTVWAWGNNAYGCIGDGTTTNRFTPLQVPGLSSVTAISAGYAHSLAIGVLGQVVRSVPTEAFAPGSFFSSASANAEGTISLSFAGALDARSAGMAANYEVSAPGSNLSIDDATYSVTGSKVTLHVDGLKAGTQVTVKWHGLLDTRGRALASGQTTIKVH